MQTLRIERACLEQIIRDAKDRSPQEACGILAGRDEVVTKVHRMENVDERPEIRYFMDPKEQLRVVKEIRSEDLTMLGIYHSHPFSPARPSGVDVEMAFYPEVAYVIVSLAEETCEQVRSFRIPAAELGTPAAAVKVEKMGIDILG